MTLDLLEYDLNSYLSNHNFGESKIYYLIFLWIANKKNYDLVIRIYIRFFEEQINRTNRIIIF